jgi:SAM-dependent methyltransferase
MKGASFRERSDAPELMDDLSIPETDLRAALADLKRVNMLLGGHRAGIAGLKPFLSRDAGTQSHILDIGCGDGEFLRYLQDYCLKKGFSARLTGWDRNAESLEAGRARVTPEAPITYQVRDVLEFPELPEGEFIIICNLFLHHFRDEEILKMLGHWSRSNCKAIVINDLDRNPLAYSLFRLFGAIFIKSKIAMHDGLVSIQRGFRRSELEGFGKSLGVRTSTVRWKWAFRYLWTLNLNEKE